MPNKQYIRPTRGPAPHFGNQNELQSSLVPLLLLLLFLLHLSALTLAAEHASFLETFVIFLSAFP